MTRSMWDDNVAVDITCWEGLGKVLAVYLFLKPSTVCLVMSVSIVSVSFNTLRKYLPQPCMPADIFAHLHRANALDSIVDVNRRTFWRLLMIIQGDPASNFCRLCLPDLVWDDGNLAGLA